MKIILESALMRRVVLSSKPTRVLGRASALTQKLALVSKGTQAASFVSKLDIELRDDGDC